MKKEVLTVVKMTMRAAMRAKKGQKGDEGIYWIDDEAENHKKEYRLKGESLADCFRI